MYSIRSIQRSALRKNLDFVVIKKIVFSSKKNYRNMAFRMASNQFRRSAMKSRNFASAAAASEKGFVEKFVPVEVRNFPR